MIEIFVNDYIDIGFVVLNGDVIAEIIKHGGKAIRTTETSTQTDNLDHCFLVGHAATHSKVTRDTLATSKEGTIETRWEALGLSELAIAFVSLKLLGDGDDPCTLKFQPIKGIDDYGGTSGGPVFGYTRGAMFNEYRLVAIQSKQILSATTAQTPKYLIATSGTMAVQTINEIVARMVGKPE